jgi:hypothetical protein
VRPLFCALFLIACGPTALRDEGSSASLSIGGSARRIETLTDLEEVRDVVNLDGIVYVATDVGLFRFASSEAPPEVIEGLPDNDVRALVEDDGAIIVAAASGMARLTDAGLEPITGAPNVGHLMDLARTADGTIWLCGLGGVARRTSTGWETFGEATRCTTLAPTPEGHLWVGTMAGLWLVEGDVIREHAISGGIPDGYVRSIVPVLPGKIFAIVQGPNDAKLAYWDGARWYGYTLRGLSGQLVGLVRRGNDVLLVTQHRLVEISPAGTGVGLVPLSNSEGTVRSFRATLTPADRPRAGETPSPDVIEEPRSIAEFEQGGPTITAPPFRARPIDVELPGLAYAGFVSGSDAFLAIANGGVLRLPARGSPSNLRTRSLVPEEDLQIATDGASTVWALSRDRSLTKFVNGRLRRANIPAGLVPQALASGPGGGYLAALEPSAGATAVRIFHNPGAGWRPFAERTMEIPVDRIPIMGVGPDRRVWIALSTPNETQAGSRVRGFAVIDAENEAVVYHHRAANREAGGLPVPDEVNELEFDTEGNAWIGSLSGLVRVDANQAVVFGESRGVRGEVVTDVAISSILWVASAEGLGSYDRTRFDYAQPPVVQSARPTRLATDVSGNVWAASSRGLLFHGEEGWVMLGEDAGLPSTDLVDVETDGSGRVWVLSTDRIMLLER